MEGKAIHQIAPTESKMFATQNFRRQRILWHIPTKRPTVFLTFDDGPDAELTPLFLDILANHNVKATFFLSGQRVIKNRDLASEIVRQGHAVGSHGHDHIRLLFRGRKKILQQVLTADQAISVATKLTPLYFRPPHGIFGPMLLHVLGKMNKVLVLWNCNARDYLSNRSPDQIIAIVRKVRPGSIVLMHDGSPHGHRTVKILPELIQQLWKDGFEFAALPG